ncbi:hypothetical protein BMETH_1181_0 [methanotrophic bacterial endosymbiont of Bathymodiolus sp.]|nr:hypothetical protein BMETH_1181_0 [methanotrophic bacterial endosymbiont of Bathymodiolus sp.]
MRRELDGAGINTRKLASENKRLGSTLDRLNTKYKKADPVHACPGGR